MPRGSSRPVAKAAPPTPVLAYEVEPSDRRFRLRLARYPFQSELLARHLPSSGGVVLDAGCGKGRLPRYFARWGAPEKAPRFVGVDLDADRVAGSKSLYDEILQLDLTHGLPFANDHFDAIVCEQVLEHLDDPDIEGVLKEFLRVLKPDGFLMIGTPVFPSAALPFVPLALWLRERFASRHDHDHLQHLDLASLRSIVSRGGFTVESARGFRTFTLPHHMLEDSRAYYRFHDWLARRFPSLCLEVTLLARPRAARPLPTRDA